MPLFKNVQLFAIVIPGVYPLQLVTVTDSHIRAKRIVRFMRDDMGSELPKIKPVNSFYPDDMTDADNAWLESYRRFITQENKGK